MSPVAKPGDVYELLLDEQGVLRMRSVDIPRLCMSMGWDYEYLPNGRLLIGKLVEVPLRAGWVRASALATWQEA
jgi:hypothetical protein